MDECHEELERLSQIQTNLSLVQPPPEAASTEVRRAQERFIHRYLGAVYRYLCATAQYDRELASDLTQEFAHKFLSGQFRKYRPDKGRFRDYLKVSLRNMVKQHHRRRYLASLEEAPHLAFQLSYLSEKEDDEAFAESLRRDLLARVWARLEAHERAHPTQPYFTLLKLVHDNPKIRSPDLAGRASDSLGKAPSTPEWARKTLERARRQFLDLLIAEVEASIGTADLHAVEEELADLGLHRYCLKALETRRSRPA